MSLTVNDILTAHPLLAVFHSQCSLVVAAAAAHADPHCSQEQAQQQHRLPGRAALAAAACRPVHRRSKQLVSSSTG
jgi:hypothetical protein